jgi:hypothetical protein
MALMYNKVLTHFSGLNAVALNEKGDLAAVSFHDRELFVYRIVEGEAIDPSQIVNPAVGALREGSSLEECHFHRLPLAAHDRASAGRVEFDDTKLAFLDDETLLVARGISYVGGGSPGPGVERPNVSLAAVRIQTGEVVAEFTDPAYGPLLTAPLIIPPHYVLFVASYTAICLEAPSLREVFRLRRFDERGEIIGEEDASAEEQICANAVAYHAASGTLHVLWRVYRSSFLQTYRLDPEQGKVERLQRRPALDGFEGNSLCLRPDGQEIAVWATVIEGTLDFRQVREPYVGATVRLGRLGMFSTEGERFFDIDSQLRMEPGKKSDFATMPAFADQPGGGSRQVGVFYGTEEYFSKPFYLNDRTVVIHTPCGAFVGVDTVSGKFTELISEFTPIRDLSVHAGKRLLLVGTEGGSFNLLGLA